MTDAPEIDFGPLTDLIGTWKGEDGMDTAPEPDGKEKNPYFETIAFTAVGDVTNAEKQTLVVVRYHQVVTRKSDGEVFHDETGYWMWDAEDKTIMHSFSIPRAVCVLAGGTHTGEKDSAGNTVLNVEARIDDPNWTIIQSPFMDKNARTVGFKHTITVGADTLSYAETTLVDIYGGKSFEHTDQNNLVRVS